MPSTKPSEATPITLIGNSLGYSMSEEPSPGTGMRKPPSDRLRQLGALVRLIQPRVHRPGLAAQRAVAHWLVVEPGHRQDLLARRADHQLVGGAHVVFGDRPQVVRDAFFFAQF